MKSDVETLSPTRVKFTIDVPFEELAPHLDAAYKRIAGQVNVPGFRKGKVPQRIIDQRFGRGVVLEEAVNEAVPAVYDAAVEEAGIVPMGQPEIDVTELNDGENLTFTVEVDVRPEFEVPDLATLTVEVDTAEVSDEDVAEQVESLRKRFATLRDVERPVEDGDVVVVDISGSVGGEDLEDLTASEMSFEVSDEEPIPGFADAVRGAVADEERAFSFAAEGGQHVGQDIDVSVTVLKVRERELPAGDDDFAVMASEFDTMAELEADTRERLARMARMEQGSQARARTQEVLLAAVDFPLPEAVVAAEVDSHFGDGHGDEGHRAEFEAEARDRLKSALLMDRIAEANELTVGQDELSAWLVQQAPRFGMSPDEFVADLVASGNVQMAVTEVRRAKALAHALGQVRIVDTNGAEIDLELLNSELSEALARRSAEAALAQS